jgi:hypothetical protein
MVSGKIISSASEEDEIEEQLRRDKFKLTLVLPMVS